MPPWSPSRGAIGIAAVSVVVAGLWLRSIRQEPPTSTGADPGVLDAQTGFAFTEKVDLRDLSLERPEDLRRVLPRTRFEFCGVVLRNGPDSDSAIDVDITLAYGGLARPEVLAAIRNEGIGYRFDDGFPYDGPYFQSHITRFHVVAASANIRRALRIRERGEAVRLSGYLVYLRRSGRIIKTDLNPRAFLCKYTYITQVATPEDVFE